MFFVSNEAVSNYLLLVDSHSSPRRARDTIVSALNRPVNLRDYGNGTASYLCLTEVGSAVVYWVATVRQPTQLALALKPGVWPYVARIRVVQWTEQKTEQQTEHTHATA